MIFIFKRLPFKIVFTFAFYNRLSNYQDEKIVSFLTINSNTLLCDLLLEIYMYFLEIIYKSVKQLVKNNKKSPPKISISEGILL